MHFFSPVLAWKNVCTGSQIFLILHSAQAAGSASISGLRKAKKQNRQPTDFSHKLVDQK
jgi:hypothetical protein